MEEKEETTMGKFEELRMRLSETVKIPPSVTAFGAKIRKRLGSKGEGSEEVGSVNNITTGVVGEFGAKISERYTPTKGLIMVLIFLAVDLALQLYLITKTATFEIVENSVRLDFVTIASFITYTLTMISILFILSEFFLMRRMEALFSIDEIKSIGNGQVDQFLESAINEEPVIVEMPEPVEKQDMTSIFDVSEDEVPSVFANMGAEEQVEEEQDSKYKVLEVTLPESEPEQELKASSDGTWDFDPMPAPEEPETADEPEKEPLFDMSESEILQTLDELKEVVNELKQRTGRR